VRFVAPLLLVKQPHQFTIARSSNIFAPMLRTCVSAFELNIVVGKDPGYTGFADAKLKTVPVAETRECERRPEAKKYRAESNI